VGKPALLIIDTQVGFLPGGSLPVPAGDEVVPVLREYARRFKEAGLPVIASRDWHPEKTVHFKEYGGLWPPHCIQGTKDAEFAPGLEIPEDAIIISAGTGPDEEGYSSFEGRDPNGRLMEDVLREEGIEHLYIGGLATDYCVKATALDALKKGFAVTLLLDAVRGIDVEPGDSERAIEEMKRAGADTATLETLDIAGMVVHH